MDVSIIVQVERVSFTDTLKYSLNNQKPPSFTCDSIILPDPIAKTINSAFISVLVIIGTNMPADVKAATVADPTHTLIKVAIVHPKKSGDKLESINKLPIY